MTQGFGHNPFDGPVGGDPFAAGPPGAPPAPPPGPGAPPVAGEPNTLATLSVVFAFVFAPAGAILGHLGLGQVARTGQPGRDRALVGVTLSYVILTTAVVALIVWAAGGNDGPSVTTTAAPPTTTAPALAAPSTTAKPTPAPPPTLEPAALQGILLKPEELRTLLGEPALEPIWSTNGVALQPERGGMEDTTCAGSFFKGTPMAYAGHEPLQFAGTDIGDRATGLLIGQGAAVFPDAAAAQRAYAAYLEYWRGCSGKSTKAIPVNPNIEGGVQTFGPPVDLGNGMAKVDTQTELNLGTFTHYIAVKNNVLLDSIFISSAIGDIPVRVTQAMLDRIPN